MQASDGYKSIDFNCWTHGGCSVRACVRGVAWLGRRKTGGKGGREQEGPDACHDTMNKNLNKSIMDRRARNHHHHHLLPFPPPFFSCPCAEPAEPSLAVSAPQSSATQPPPSKRHRISEIDTAAEQQQSDSYYRRTRVQQRVTASCTQRRPVVCVVVVSLIRAWLAGPRVLSLTR